MASWYIEHSFLLKQQCALQKSGKNAFITFWMYVFCPCGVLIAWMSLYCLTGHDLEKHHRSVNVVKPAMSEDYIMGRYLHI